MEAWDETEPIFNRSAIEGWRSRAACASLSFQGLEGILYQSLFFPTKGERVKQNIARSICSECPVYRDCLKFAMETKQQHGIWGGLSEDERHHLISGRAKRAGKCRRCGLIRVYFDDTARLCDICNGITKLDRKNKLSLANSSILQ